MYEFGKRLKALREQKKISQKEFARRIGAKNTTVSNWESGLTRPDVDKLAEICTVLGVSADELLDIHLPEEVLTLQEKQVIAQYRGKPSMHRAVHVLLGLEVSPDE